jgi:DNA-binding GntR family transcriptional regulator
MADILPGVFQLDRSRSATVQVYEHLREMIVTLAVKPGAVLPRTELSDYFKLSLTPIREALTRLEEERLVDIYPQHQTRVSAIDLASARQAHFLRLSLEVEIVAALARKPDPQLEVALMELVGRQAYALGAGDLESFTRTDMQFHQRLYHEAQLPDLWSMMRSSSGNLDRLRRLHLPLNGKAQSVLDEHTYIARCIGAGEGARARKYVREHLSGTMKVLETLRRQYKDFVLPDDYAPQALSA